MRISLVKISEEFNNINGRHLWLGCEVVVNEGEDEKLAAKKGMDFLLEVNKEASEMPVIQDKRRVVYYPEDDSEFIELKEALSKFEFKEDAEEYLQSTIFRHTIEAKQFINNKPSKHAKK